MPESVLDRPSNALEWLFLFSRSGSYFWDAEAIRQQHRDMAGGPERFGNLGALGGNRGTVRDEGDGRGDFARRPGGREYNPAGRAFRNTDPWFLSLDAAIADARADLARLEAMRATGGVLTDDDGLPLAVDINPAAYKEAHFATYPPALTEQYSTARRHQAGVIGNAISGIENARKEMVTLGWAPSCACSAGDPQPCVVLDCFAGSGTTLLVADRLGRDAVGIELSEAYADMARARLAADAPLWADVVDVEADGYAPLALFEEMAI